MTKELEIQYTPQIYCPKRMFELQDITRCEHCSFLDGNTETTVKCKYDRSMMLQNMHVTEFWNGKKQYRAKNWKDLSEEEQNNYISKYDLDKKDYDVCYCCCFNETLDNGQEICLLRQSAGSNEINAFLCYEYEFWELSKIYEDEEDTENADDIEETTSSEE